jgi:hypothetical protein
MERLTIFLRLSFLDADSEADHDAAQAGVINILGRDLAGGAP